jgi:archaellum component FlaG (FlaF/FlaG flagellin family)
MSYRKSIKNDGRRAASVIVCVLVMLLLVGLLSVQTLQTLSLIRRSDSERAKIRQARELIELGRQIDWNAADSQTLTLRIPDSANSVAAAEMQTVTLERQADANHSNTARFIAIFPADKPGSVTTTEEIEIE